METSQLTPCSGEWLLQTSILALQDRMEAGELTSKQLVQLYLERIAQYNHQGQGIRAVLELNPDALFVAESLDLERKKKGIRGPLHGIPVLVKDNLDTGDKMHTSAGSLALANSYAKQDSFVAAQLRQAGAVILGKTNMTEWANFMADNMTSGYSSRGGQVLNPYGPGKFDVGGSSSGSGASVAAGLAAAAIGTETSGSILSPASANSVVGIKPTVGLVSRTGIIPIAHSQDTAGPMAQNVTDAAILLGVIAGVDERDPATWTSEGRAYTDYTQFLDETALKGARIGVAREVYFTKLPEGCLAIMENAIEVMKNAGATVVDPIELPAKELWGYQVLVHEFKSDLNAYLSGLAPDVPIHSLKDLIAFNNEDPETMLKFGQAILTQAEATSGTLTEAEYISHRLKDLRFSQQEGIDKALEEHQLDALLFPANWGAGIGAKAGYPSITVPGGYTAEGEPFGVTFCSTAYSEPTLIRLAYAFEQLTKYRVPPTMQ